MRGATSNGADLLPHLEEKIKRLRLSYVVMQFGVAQLSREAFTPRI